jgi:hypothetical protein
LVLNNNHSLSHMFVLVTGSGRNNNHSISHMFVLLTGSGSIEKQ